MAVIDTAEERLQRLWRPSPARAAALARLRRQSPPAEAAVRLAESRLRSLIHRQMGPAIAALVAAAFLSPLTALAFVLANLLSEIVDFRLNRHVIRSASAETLSCDGLRLAQQANALLNAGTHAVYVVVLWLEGPPELRIFCLGFLGIAVLYSALHVNAVRYVLRLREGVYLLTGAALCLYDLIAPDAVGATQAVVQLIVVLTVWLRMRSWIGLMVRNQREAERAARVAEDARDAALAASAARSRFFAMVSHELRTPLNGLLGMAQSLLNDRLTPAERQKAEVIAESGRTLTALLTDVLDLSKMEAGRLDIRPAPENLHAGLDHARRLHEPVALAKGLDLSLEILEGVPAWLEHDGVRLRQCLSNLLSNAIKFTDRGEVAVVVSAGPLQPDARRSITIEVRDTGVGLEPDAGERLFEPFVQADAALPRQLEGTGLGLAIARRLARLMGGDLVCAPREGGGAVFTLSFIGREIAPPEMPADRAADTPDLSGALVLVADDVETNRAVARLFLEPAGVRVIEAEDGAAALAVLRREPLDAALLDLRMPALSGEEVVRVVRSGRAGDRSVPVIAITADHHADAATLGRLGFDAVLLKPLDQEALRVTLGAALRPRRSALGPVHPRAAAG